MSHCLSFLQQFFSSSFSYILPVFHRKRRRLVSFSSHRPVSFCFSQKKSIRSGALEKTNRIQHVVSSFLSLFLPFFLCLSFLSFLSYFFLLSNSFRARFGYFSTVFHGKKERTRWRTGKYQPNLTLCLFVPLSLASFFLLRADRLLIEFLNFKKLGANLEFLEIWAKQNLGKKILGGVNFWRQGALRARAIEGSKGGQSGLRGVFWVGRVRGA